MATPTADELYNDTVKQLPLKEQLRLAAMILDAITQSASDTVDESGVWTDEDLRDLTAASLRYASPPTSSDEI